MFTGIVQAVGKIRAIQSQTSGVRLLIDRQGWRPAQGEPALGDSVCVSGVCLTLAASDASTFEFDVIAQTLATTTIGRLAVGSGVNLEPCVTPSTPLGGHIVQGHVDGVGHVRQVRSSPQEWCLRIAPPEELMDYIIPKGSIALDGVSLTLAGVDRDSFEVALIPTTLKLTTLGALRQGDALNIETDIVSKTIVHWLRRQAGGGGADTVTIDTLRRAGFVG